MSDSERWLILATLMRVSNWPSFAAEDPAGGGGGDAWLATPEGFLRFYVPAAQWALFAALDRPPQALPEVSDEETYAAMRRIVDHVDAFMAQARGQASAEEPSGPPS